MAAIVGAAVAASAQDFPLRTETALTAAAGTLTVANGFDWFAAQPNFLTGVRRDTWAGPLLRFTFSPSDNTEFDLEWVARVGQRGDSIFGSTSDFGDVSLRAKLRLLDRRARRPALAARLAVTLPETSFGDGLGPNTLRLAVETLVTQPLGRARLDANAGLALQDEPLRAHEQRDFLSYGLALVYRWNARLELLGEVAGLAGKGSPGADAHAELRWGARFGRGRLRAAGVVRRGLLAADGRWGLSAGVTYRLRPRE